MFERFTDRARKVMSLANQEAQRFNHEYVGAEHILLGIVKEGQVTCGIGGTVLGNLGVDLKKIRLEVEKLVFAGPEQVTMGNLPKNPSAKKAIDAAIEEARGLNHNYVGTEHLLLGLIRDGESIAGIVLTALGLTAEKIRKAVLELLTDPAKAPEAVRQAAPALLALYLSEGHRIAIGEHKYELRGGKLVEIVEIATTYAVTVTAETNAGKAGQS